MSNSINADEGEPSARDSLGAVEFAEKLLRWVSQNAYHTPIDDFSTGLGAVWLSFCFDHDLNPFVELHAILNSFPFTQALGTVVPEWAKGEQRPIRDAEWAAAVWQYVDHCGDGITEGCKHCEPLLALVSGNAPLAAPSAIPSPAPPETP